MPRYAFIVKVLSPRDGGWLRWGGYWATEEDAWQFIQIVFDVMVLHGDYLTVNVQRVIRF